MKTNAIPMIRINCCTNELEKKALPFCRNKIFHVTHQEGFNGIMASRCIKHQNTQSTHIQSSTSYCKTNNSVSLFNFINATESDIKDTLEKLNFLSISIPNNSLKNYKRHRNTFVFLIAKIIEVHLIRPTGYDYIYVPRTEVCFPGDIPLAYIEQILHINEDCGEESPLRKAQRKASYSRNSRPNW